MTTLYQIAHECLRLLLKNPIPEMDTSRDWAKTSCIPEEECFITNSNNSLSLFLFLWYCGVRDRMILSITTKTKEGRSLGVDMAFPSQMRFMDFDELSKEYLDPAISSIAARFEEPVSTTVKV